MKTCRKSVATVLLLSIHLLTLRISDVVAERNDTSVEVNPKIILEEVIITGSGNDTRIVANAVAEDASKIGDGLLSLLSKRTSSNSDLDTAQSVNIDVNEDDLERLKRVIAKYEPKRIASRKTKRKIIKDAHDILQGKVAESTTNLETAYDEVLRNISRRAPELTSSNIDATLNPYLSQTRKNLIGIYVPEATIRSVNHDDAQKSHSVVDSSYTSPTTSDKKKLLKKYLQLNRTLTIPRGSPVLEESRFNEGTADSDESIPPGRYLKVPNVKTRPNESLSPVESSSNVYPESTEKPERKWNIQDSSFIPRLHNNSYDVFNVNNLNNLNFPSDTSTVQLLSKYDRMPRPFSLSQSPDSPVIATPYSNKPSPSSATLNRQQVARPSTSVLPLILPTETLFDPSSARRYVPIKRANHFKAEGADSFNTEASPANERTTFANYGIPTAPYTNIIGTTKSPLIRIPSLNYYAITENPVEQDVVTRTNSPKIIHVPNQTSPSYTLQQEKDSQGVRRNGFLPDAYNIPDNKQSNLNSNAGLELYNKFASLYSANVPNNAFNVPKVVTQNYQNFGQYVSTPSYATLKPISPSLPKIQPIAPAKPVLAPYYDSGLLVSQRAEEKELDDKRNEENVEVNKPRAVDEDESNTEASDNENNFGNYKAPINRESYKSHKTSNEQREKEDREEEDKTDRYQQPKRNYDYQDKYQKYNKDDKNNDRREKYNVRHKDNEEEEEEEEKDADETQKDEYVSIKKNQDERNHRYQYNKHKYDRDDSEEEVRDKPSHKKRDKEKKSFRDERDDEKDKVKDKFVSGDKNFDGPRYSDYEPDEKYRKKDRDEDSEDESVTEDKLVARHSKDERARKQRERYEEDEKKGDNVTQKPKSYRHRQTIPRKDSHREEQKREEYSETKPKHVREEYRHHLRHPVEDDEGLSHRGRDSESDKERVRDHEHGETQEHAHKHEKHHEEKKDGGNHEYEEGGGAEHENEHHGHKAEKGHEGYKVWDEHEKAEKGHHDKEHATKEYDEKDGEEKKHEEEGGYHEEHQHDEGGKKESEFGEKGEHKKGHSTHGEHSVHKKDEYEKKTEFFDEFHDDGDVEKHGEHHHEHESKKGGHEKKGHHDVGDHEQKYGKEEKHEKGGHHHEHKGHKADEGHDHHYEHNEKHGKKEGHESGKKWSFKKGDHGGDEGGHR